MPTTWSVLFFAVWWICPATQSVPPATRNADRGADGDRNPERPDAGEPADLLTAFRSSSRAVERK